MSEKLYLDPAAEKEANEIGTRFMNSSDVVGDMSREFGRDLSSVRIHADGDADSRAAQRGVDAFSTGSDVFFARGAFNNNDSASRGLLAHELAHSMQQGLGGGGVETAAPAGAAQGGFLDWFRRHFGNNNATEGENAPDNEFLEPNATIPGETENETFGEMQDANNTVPGETENEADEEAEQAASTETGDPRRKLESAAEKLRTSEKVGGGKNSEKFNRVSDAITLALGALSSGLTGTPEEKNDVLANVIDAFRELIQSCNDYLNRNAWTDKGKHRQNIVRYVRELAVEDHRGFVLFRETPNKDPGITNALQVLTESRQRTLKLVALNEAQLQHYGGAGSYLAKIDAGMLEDEEASGFFKAEESYVKFEDGEQGDKEEALWAVDVANRRKPVSEETYDEVRSHVETHGIRGISELPRYWTDREFHEFVDAVLFVKSANYSAAQNVKTSLKAGEGFSLSKRNVATSRLADVLGIGDLVARSETATLEDATGGGSIVGNFMQEAQGQELMEYFYDQMRDEYAEKRMNAQNMNEVKQRGIDLNVVTPQFMKSLISLQVLDNLAGQVDRHTSNVFVQVDDDNRLGKVQGIDNDYSFGMGTLNRGVSDINKIGSHGRSILDHDGKLILPYMDHALAERITELSEADLRIIMADVLEPWAIDALCVRFNKVQAAILHDQMIEGNTQRYLGREEDWGTETVVNAILNGGVVESQNNVRRHFTNYASNFVLGTQTENGATDISDRLETDFKESVAKKVMAQVPDRSQGAEAAKDYLREYGVGEKVLSYLEITGQLWDGPALVTRLRTHQLRNPIAKKVIEKHQQRTRQQTQNR